MGKRGKQKKIIFISVFLLLIFSAFNCFASVSQKINYQGFLANNMGEPLNDTVSILFSIYEVGSGGTALWTETQSVEIVDGVFDVLLGGITSFPPDLFNEPLYLGITVATDSEMTPRQEITSTAFSFKAKDADFLSGLPSGAFSPYIHEHDSEYINVGEGDSITSAMIENSTISLNDIKDGTVLGEILDDDGSGSGLDADIFDGLNSSSFFILNQNEIITGIPAFNGGVSGKSQPFSVDSNTIVQSLNADYLDGWHGSSYTRTTQDYGRSGVSSTLYEGAVSLSSKYLNETGPDAMSGSGTANILSVTNTYTGTTVPSAAIYATSAGGQTTGAVIGEATGSSGDGVYGHAIGAYGVGVKGTADGDYGYGVYGYSPKRYGIYGLSAGSVNGYSRGVYGSANNTGDVENYGGYFRAYGDRGRGVYGYASDSGYVTNYGGYFQADGDLGKAGFFKADGQYAAGLWAENRYSSTTLYARLASATTAVTGYYSGSSYAWLGTQNYAVWGQNGYTNGFGGKFRAYGTNGIGVYGECTATGGWAGVFRGKVKIQNNSGQTVMEMGEGLDYAEGFDVTSPLKVEPGFVMVIDPDNPGKLTICKDAYDKRVAGIVAGANNLGSGVRLGAGRFDHDIALAGRVYCNVDASSTAIEPGDLLTTSNLPGHAMKVRDSSLAQGAILGKAMEKLNKGKTGKILVLVTLQ